MSLDQDQFFHIVVGEKGIYARVWALRRCGFFQRMFGHVMKETITGSCEIDITAISHITDVEAFSLIFFFLHNGMFEVTADNWKSLLFAADFLDCPQVKGVVAQFLLGDYLNENTCVSVAEFVNPGCSWGIPIVFAKAVEIIEAYLHEIISSGEFVALSSTTLDEIFKDPTMTYFTMEERYNLLTEWATLNKCDLDDIRDLFNTIDLDQVPNHCVKSMASSSWYRLRQTDIDNRLKRPKAYKTTRPVLVVAGGAGRLSANLCVGGENAWPLEPSSTLFSFDFVGEYWTRLPDVPLPLIDPLVAGDGKDRLFVADKFRSNIFDKNIFLHCLEQVRGSWYTCRWRTLNVTLPAVFLTQTVYNMYYSCGSVYLLCQAKMYTEVFLNWGESDDAKMRIHEEEQTNPKYPRAETMGALFLLKVDPDTGNYKVAAFLFLTFDIHSEFSTPVLSCLAGNKICVLTRRVTPFNVSLLYPHGIRFAVYDCAAGAILHNEETWMSRFRSLTCLVPTTTQDGVVTISMFGGRGKTFSFSTWKWNGQSYAVNWPHRDSMIDYSLVPRRGLFYILGGYSRERKMSVPFFMCYNTGHSDLNVDGFQNFGWRTLPDIPMSVFRTGTTVTRLRRDIIKHHSRCPHCLRLNPKEKLAHVWYDHDRLSELAEKIFKRAFRSAGIII